MGAITLVGWLAASLSPWTQNLELQELGSEGEAARRGRWLPGSVLEQSRSKLGAQLG